MRTSGAAAQITLIVCATVIIVAGIGLLSIGAIRHTPTISMAGTSASFLGITMMALTLIHRWITTTDSARQQLAAAAREHHSEQTRYVAASAAVQQERERNRRDLRTAQEQMDLDLTAEKERLRQELDDERSTISREAFQLGVMMERSGALRHPDAHSGTVVHLPQRPAPPHQRTGVPH
ncbi:hypothetical protein [Streptomyces chumphonensis]|uniref:hypothetical protein n=1 Tax=Streptomyces chumphonensis TaxID=1214925 RepID=UPI003D766409